MLPLRGSEEWLLSTPRHWFVGHWDCPLSEKGKNHKKSQAQAVSPDMLFTWIAREKKEMFTQANPWNMNLDPFETLRENPNYCLCMLRLLLHFRPRATKEVKGNLTSIQRTRVMVISSQNILRRTIRFEGVKTRVWASQVVLVEKNPPAKQET